MPDVGTLVLVAALCMVGGFLGGIVGVGGGVIFVPVMVVFLDLGQVEAEATSLVMIAIVGLAGTLRQRRYGNVNIGDAAWVALLSPVGVATGVVVANLVPERALELGFAALCVAVAVQLLRGVRSGRRPVAPEPVTGSEPGLPRRG